MTTPRDQRPDRRRHPRIPLGMPVRVHFAGRATPLTVELADVSAGGCYFRGAAAPRSAKFAFGFVLPERQMCVAACRVLRVDSQGFAARIERANDTFSEFFSQLSGPVAATAA